MEGLAEKTRKKPCLKNRACLEIEVAVVKTAEKFPAYAQMRASNELGKAGIPGGRWDVRRIRQRRGIGAGLLLDALGRTLQVADVVGIRALAVHAKDDTAAAFYRHFGFIPSPVDGRHLFMLIKDIRAAAGD